MIVTSVQIKTAKTQKHLYCPVFTTIKLAVHRRVLLLIGYDLNLRPLANHEPM